MIKRFTSLNKKEIILITIILSLFGIVIFYNSIKYKIINKEVKELVQKESKGLYVIKYDSISIDELAGNLILKNIYLTPDTVLQLQMLSSGDTSAAKMLMSIFIPRIEVRGFKTTKALLSQQLICNTIRIVYPQATVYIFPSDNKAKAREQKQEELYKQILGNMKLIYADSVAVVNSNVHAIDFFSKQTKFHSYGTSVNLHAVRIDSAYYHDKTRTLFSKYIQVHSDRVMLGQKGKEAEILNLDFNTDKKQLRFSSFNYDAYKTDGSFKSQVNDVRIDGLQWKGAAEYSSLSLKNVVVGKMMFELTSNEKSSKQKMPKTILSGWIKDFDLEKLEIKDFGLINKNSKPGAKDFIINNSSLIVENVHLDTTAKLNNTLLSKVKNLEINNRLIEFISEDKMYKYQLADIKLNTAKNSLAFSEIKIIPQLRENAFVKKYNVQKDRYELIARSVICNNIDLNKLINKEVFIKDVMVKNTLLNVYRDLHMPADQTSKIGNYPHQLLMKLKTAVKIDKIELKTININYRENSAIGDSIGNVTFNRGNVIISNASNVYIINGETMGLRFNTFFLNKIPLYGKFTFYLNEWKRGKFNVVANVDKTFDAKLLNAISIPLSLIRLEKGEFNRIKSNINGDNTQATGTLKLTYKNLKISLLKRKDDEINRKTVFSLLANLLVKNNNKRGDMRTSEINFQRDTTKSIFNFIWKAIFSGAKEILGIKL